MERYTAESIVKRLTNLTKKQLWKQKNRTFPTL
jgi:hypothetical protein